MSDRCVICYYNKSLLTESYYIILFANMVLKGVMLSWVLLSSGQYPLWLWWAALQYLWLMFGAWRFMHINQRGGGRETVTGWSVCICFLRQLSWLQSNPSLFIARTHLQDTHPGPSHMAKCACVPQSRRQHADVIIEVIAIEFQRWTKSPL